MDQVDIRWQQRLTNFESALSKLEAAVGLTRTRALSDLEQLGLIQAFEFTHELAWNVLRDYLKYQGMVDLIGYRDTSRAAFQAGLVVDGDAWMEMIQSRNLTSHTYNQKVADDIVGKILSKYFPCFKALHKKMHSLKSK